MNIETVTKASTAIETSAVQINAMDSEKLANFYQVNMGMTLLEQRDDAFVLGTATGRVLLELYQADSYKEANKAGLYHFALLLPSRADLGAILRYLLERGVELTGASDHGYSEALYLDDPEGNGIEIYADKDRSVWDIQDNGLIAGVVEPMDAEGVLASAQDAFAGLPEETVMGHIHLHVGDLAQTLAFYHEILGLGLKYVMGQQALFMATGASHHHLGANLWNGVDIKAGVEGSQGLRASIWQANAEDFARIKARLDEEGYAYQEEPKQIALVDPAGTRLLIQVA